MATIKVGIDVSDNGTAEKATQAAQRLKNAYDAANASASKIGAGTTKTAGVAQSQAITSQELVAYNRQRSIAQGTGASARDFAKQSEGLGGLVRLYATFAANVFAVSAAFNALSNAMDTTNMIKGLDQLGAASGQALGGLSKRFVEVTDGAISLRESVESVAKASAAGLSSKQILQIGENAKKASQALGVNMSDAVSRLTRGITKLEPELLDELGIYTKLEESVNKYALSVGKTASSLTDFERRQAFAVAVLDEANKKFGAIELDTNPYSKLLATFKDVTFAGLELVNKVLSPVVALLGQSPIALAGILALIGKQLVGTALPALGKFREGLKQQAIESKKALEEAQASRSIKRERISEEEAIRIGETTRIRAEEAAMAAERARTVFSTGRARPAFLANIPSAAELKASEPDLPKLQAYVKEQEKKIKLLKADDKASDQVKARIEAQTKAQQDLIDSTKALIQAAEKQNNIDKESIGKPGRLSKEAKDIRELEAATKRVRADELLKGITEAYDTQGFSAGFKKLGTSVVESRKELGLFRTAAMATQGSMLLLAGGIGQVMSALNPILFAVTTAITIFGLLDGVLSKNSKQAEETNKSFELVDEALKNIDKTAAALSKKDLLERLSSSSMVARAKSVNELSTAIEDLVQKVEVQDKTKNTWDDLVDSFKKIWGGDLLSKSSDKLSKSISTLLSTAGGPEAEQASQNLKELVGVDPRDQEAFRKALEESPQKFLELAPKVAVEAQNLTNKLTALAGVAQQASDDLDTASKSQSEFITSALPSDKLSKFGIDLIKSGNSIKNALKDVNSELAVLQKLLKDPEKLKLFSKDFQEYFLKNRDSIQANITVVQAYRAEIEKLQKTPVSTVFGETGGGAAFGYRTGGARGATDFAQRQAAATAQRQETITVLQQEIKKIETSIASALSQESEKMIKNGVDFVTKATKELLQKAAGIITSAKIDLLGTTEEAIKERTKLDNLALDAQIAVLETEKNLIGSQDSLQQAIELQTLAVREQTAEQRAATKFQAPGADRAAIQSELDSALVDIVKERQKILLPAPNTKLVDVARRQIDAQVGILQAQKQANILKQQGQLIDLSIRKREEAFDLQIKQAEAEKDRLELLKTTQGFLDRQKQAQLEAANRTILNLQQSKEQLQLDRERQKINLVRKQPGVALQEETRRNELLQRRQQLEERIQKTNSETLQDSKKVEEARRNLEAAKVLPPVDTTRSTLAQRALEELRNGTADSTRFNELKISRDRVQKDIQDQEILLRTKEAAFAQIQNRRAELNKEIDAKIADIDALQTGPDLTDAGKQRQKEYLENERKIRQQVIDIEETGIQNHIKAINRGLEDLSEANRNIIDQQNNLYKTAQSDRSAAIKQAEDQLNSALEGEKTALESRLKTRNALVAALENELDTLLRQEAVGFEVDKKSRVQALQGDLERTKAEIESVTVAIEKARSTGLGAGSLKELDIRQKQLDATRALADKKFADESAKRTAENQSAADQKVRESVEKLSKLQERAEVLVFEQKLERLKVLEKLGIISTEAQIKRQADLETAQEKQNLKAKINSINEERNKELQTLQDYQAALKAIGAEDTVQGTINVTVDKYEQIIQAEEALSRIRQSGIDQLKEQNLLIESQNKLIKALEDAADVSRGAFKTLFSVFAELQKQQVDFTKQSTTLIRTRAAEEEQIGIDYQDNEEERKKQLILVDKKYNDLSTKLMLERDQKQFASAKNLFSSKTVAFKALSALEKASAAQTLVLNLQTTASNIASLASKVVSGAANMFAQGGFAGFAGVGAMLALLSSLGLFKKSVKVSAGPSTEDIQKAQLTGQVYQNNQLVTAKGALGADPTAKLESIDKSLELIKNSGFQDLNFSGTSTNYLEKIEQNTRGLSESLAVSLSGIPAGVKTGVITPGPFGSFSKPVSLAAGAAGAGLMAVGAGQLGLAIQPLLSAVVPGFASSILGVLGGPFGIAAGFLLGKNLDKILNSIFGGKTTQTLKDFGITAEGTINSLSDTTTALVDTYTTIQTTVKGGLFRRTKVTDRTETEKASDDITEYISFLFSDIKKSFLSAGSVLGKDVSSILENYVIQPISISTKDLKPEEIAQAIKNKLSLVFNEISLQALGPLIEALRQPLEEAGTTLTRLTAQTQAFSDGMLLLGKNVEDITGTLKVVIADDLVKAFGSLENYQNKIQFFRENFLTEAEQIAPVSQKLTEELNKLGISTNLTRDQYKSLVLQQEKLAKTSGRETFVALLNLGEAFDKVTDFAEKAKEKLKGFSDGIRNFIKDQTLQAVGTAGSKSLLKEFQSTVEKSLQGDEKSLSYLTEIAGKTIETARNSARTTKEFNLLRAGVISSLAGVASEIESGNIKLLTPQEQTNVILEQIEQNTSSLPEDIAQQLASQIDTSLNAISTTVTNTVPSTVPATVASDLGIFQDGSRGEGGEYAKGGTFYKGVQMFESGGAFSNSVVSNPTMFPMGVMGEAGPEAIMPLTRMNDGSLGVRVNIPFNNNNQLNQQLIQEVRELKKEMEKVRIGVEVTATGTNKTFRLLDRVAENGNALNVLVTT